MTRTSWSSANSRSARCEPMNPPPPVIRTFTGGSFRRKQFPELVLPVVEQPLPELQRQQAPGLAAEPVLLLEPAEHLAIVEMLAPARLPRREDVGDEVARRAAEPLVQRNREAHLVLALGDPLGDERSRRALEDVLHRPVAELDVGRD